MSSNQDGKPGGPPHESLSYIDSLFFENLPSMAQHQSKHELEEKSPDFDVADGGYVDRAYFQQEKISVKSEPPSPRTHQCHTESATGIISEVREQFRINQYSGGTLDIKGSGQRKRPIGGKLDSQGFRVPDDDPIKLHLLTEDEAAHMLFKCLIAVQDNVIVVNKPPGISSQGGRGQDLSVDGLLSRLAHKLRRTPHDELEEFQITHRLDKEATGALLISRNRDTHLKLTEAFANRWIKKSYLCITSGIPKEQEGYIYQPISEQRVGGVYRMVAHRPKVNESSGVDILNDQEAEEEILKKKTNAITHYRVLERRNDAALLDCTAITGIKHQIRTHLSAALETPILGDHKYSHYGHMAPQRLSKRTLDALEVRQSKVRYIGLHLHAHKLVFQGTEVDEQLKCGQTPALAPPPGFFGFIERPGNNLRQTRSFTAPVPNFFVSNLRRLGMHLPSVLKWTRFKVF